MEPEYTAVTSASYEISFLICLLLLILGIVPGVIYIAVKVSTAHHHIYEFYPNKYVEKSGIFNTQESDVAFRGITSVSCDRSIGGVLFGYGTVTANVTAKSEDYKKTGNDIADFINQSYDSSRIIFVGVKDPEGLKKYLLTQKGDPNEINRMVIV